MRSHCCNPIIQHSAAVTASELRTQATSLTHHCAHLWLSAVQTPVSIDQEDTARWQPHHKPTLFVLVASALETPHPACPVGEGLAIVPCLPLLPSLRTSQFLRTLLAAVWLCLAQGQCCLVALGPESLPLLHPLAHLCWLPSPFQSKQCPML